MATAKRRVRLSIDVEPRARMRLNIAAARRDQAIREYVWEAVEARLKEDGLGETTDAPSLHAETDTVLAELWDNRDDARYDDL